MVKKSGTHVEGRSKAARQAQRRRLGPLRTLTVQSKTRARYDKAMERYRTFLREESRPYPRNAAGQDYVLSHYTCPQVVGKGQKQKRRKRAKK